MAVNLAILNPMQQCQQPDHGSLKFFGMESKSPNPARKNRRPEPKFQIGDFAITTNALSKITYGDAFRGLGRHIRGDWGEVCKEDAKANEEALLHGERLMSVYRTAADVKFWIITEADRSCTTVLLPEDY